MSQDRVHKPQLLKRKESWSCIEPRSFRLPAYRLTARPNRLSCCGDKKGGSFIPWKIRHRWPRIWNKRRICNRKGKAALPCPCVNREACCLQLGQLTGANWNHTLVSGFTRERRLLHPTTALRPSTNELLTELKKFSSFQHQNLQRQFYQQSD